MKNIPVLLMLPAIVLICVAMYFGWRRLKYLWVKEGKKEQAELELIASLRARGTEHFPEVWVLALSTTIPRVTPAPVSLSEYLSRLEQDYGKASTAMKYFPGGKYLVSRDGSMRQVKGDEPALSELLQVRAMIKVNELPPVDLIRSQIAGNPMNYVEARKRCVLLNVRAHGTAQKGRLRFQCTPQFAARDGKIIVESI